LEDVENQQKQQAIQDEELLQSPDESLVLFGKGHTWNEHEMKGLLIFQVDVCSSVPEGRRRVLLAGPVRTVDMASSREASGISCNNSAAGFRQLHVQSQHLEPRCRM